MRKRVVSQRVVRCFAECELCAVGRPLSMRLCLSVCLSVCSPVELCSRLLCSELPNRVEEVKKNQDVKAVFEVIADLAGAIDGTPSMMEDGG